MYIFEYLDLLMHGNLLAFRVNKTGWTAWEWDDGIADMIEIPTRIAFFFLSFWCHLNVIVLFHYLHLAYFEA